MHDIAQKHIFFKTTRAGSGSGGEISGSGSGKKVRIRPDPDPQHWLRNHFDRVRILLYEVKNLIYCMSCWYIASIGADVLFPGRLRSQLQGASRT
jgi:hypothetical protein